MSGDLGFGQKTCLTYSLKLQHRYLVRTVSAGIGKCVWIYVNANVWRSCLGVGFRKLFAAFLTTTPHLSKWPESLREALRKSWYFLFFRPIETLRDP